MTNNIAIPEEARAFNPLVVLTEPTVLVRVGAEEDEEQFHVHKQLLMAKSAYFRGALAGGNFQEGVNNEVVLRDIDPRPFSVLLAWMYSGSLEIIDVVYKDESNEVPRDSYLTDIYVLADRFLVPGCKLNVLELAAQYFNTAQTPASHDAIIDAFENLSGHDVYLRLLVDTYCKYLGDEIPEEGFSDLPNEFLFRVVSLMHKHSKSQLQFLDTDICYYNPSNNSEENSQSQEQFIMSAWD